MMHSLHWRSTLTTPEAREQLRGLQNTSLRQVLIVTGVCYLVAHPLLGITAPPQQALRWDTMLLLVLPCLAVCYCLLARRSSLAAWFFIGSLIAATTWSLYYVGYPAGASRIFFVMAGMLAALLIHPLGGFITVGAATLILLLMGGSMPQAVAPSDVWQTTILGVLAVIAVWTMMHQLFQVLRWYDYSFQEADTKTREAREHRADLFLARQQLDIALRRLERANAALRVAWKAADESERARMELATNISHELRTPLNLIVGYAEMILSSPGSYGGKSLPKPYQTDVRAIYRAAQHLLALADDVLDLARMEIGRMGMVKDAIDLGEVIREAIRLIEDYVESKGLTLDLRLPDSRPEVMADRLRIRQVLLNLLTNAARLTQTGGMSVSLSYGATEAKVAVTDTGPGMTGEQLSRVFRPFMSTDSPRPGWHGGAGIGLALSKGFIEMHGGEMGAESTPGLGTTFWFTLPRTAPDSARRPAKGSRSALSWPSNQELTIVVAHGDAGLASMLQRHLDGVRVEAADGLDAASTLALELSAAAILADAGIRRDDWEIELPTIWCPLPLASRLSERMGVAGYLVKPVSRQDLVAAIEKLAIPVRSALVVDDDPSFARLLTRMLHSVDSTMRVSAATSGEEALERLQADRTDLLLLDLRMPGLGGAGVLEAMSRDPEYRDIRVIVVSAYQEGESEMPLGRSIEIVKPEGLQLEEVIEIVGSALRRLAPPRTALAATAQENGGEYHG